MDFFHSLPVPEFWEWDFFIPFPFPKFGNGFFYSLPVPEFQEWAFSIPFPFPNPQKSIPLTPDVVKASEEDRRESLKSTTISFEDADERVKKGTFMEFFWMRADLYLGL